MSSDCPPQLQLSIPQSTTSFKRSFEQFGVDLDSPVALDAGGSGNNNDRNKRARSATSFSDGSSDTLGSSPQSSSDASGSGSGRRRALQNDWPGQTSLSGPAASRAGTVLPTSMSHSSHQPPRLPTPDIQDIEMPDYPLVEDNDSDAFSSPNLPSPPLSQRDDGYRLSLQRFNEFDSEISVLRRSQSRSPTLARSPTLPPTLPPLSIFEEIPSQTTIEFLPDSPVSGGRASPDIIFPRHGLPDPEADSDFSLDFSGSSFGPSQQHSPIDGPETHHPHLEPAPRSGGPESSASNDIGFTFRERLDSALGSLRSASPLVPGLDEEEEQLSSPSSSSTRPTLPNPPTLPPIITDTENENEMWNDEPLPTPASEGPWNMPPSLPSLEDLRDHGLPSPSLRGLHHWLSMDELPRRQVVSGTSSSSPRSSPGDDPGPSNGMRDRARDPTQHPQSWHGGPTSSNASGRGGGPRDNWHPPAQHLSSGTGRRSPASAAAVRMLDQVMWNSSYSSSLFSGRSRSPPPSSERPSQFLSHSPSVGRPPAHFPFQNTDMNFDQWLAGDDESAGPSDTATGLSSSVHPHPWTDNDEHQPSHMLAQLRSRPAHLGSSNSLVSENAAETRRRSERAELMERSTTFATSSRIPLMEDGRRSHIPAWDGEWAQSIAAPESAQSQSQPERIQPIFHDERAIRQSESQPPSPDSGYPRPSNSRSFEEMFEAFLGPENDEFRQRTRPQQQQQHSYLQYALASFQRDRAPPREYFPRARAPSPSPGPPQPPAQQLPHRRISSWSNSASAPQGDPSSAREAHQVPASETFSHSRAGAGLFDSQATGGRVLPPAVLGPHSYYHGSTAPVAREEQPRPYLPIPSLPSPDLGGIFDRAAPPARAQEHTSASLQRNQRVADERIRNRDNLLSQLGPFRRASATRRRQNSLDYLRGMTSVVDLNRLDHELSDDDEDSDEVVLMGNRPTRFGRSNEERVATGVRASTGGMEAGSHQGSFYNRHGRFLPMNALAASLNVPSRTDYAEQIPQSGTSASNRNSMDNSSSSSSDAEHYEEVPAATRRSTYLNVPPAHRARTPPLDIPRYPTQPTAESRPRFRPTVPSQAPGPQQPQPASNVQPFDPSSFAPGPFRNTLQRMAQDHQRQVMERNNRAGHYYYPNRPARSSQPPPLSHAPSIPPLAFEEDNSNLQGRAPPRPDVRYEYPSGPPLPPQRSYVEYPRAPPTYSSRTEPFQRQPPPAPGTGSSAAQNDDLHRYLSRQARMEASRIDDSDGSRPAPPVQSRGDAQGFNSAIEVLRHDGLSPLRSRQLIERYNRERGEQAPRNHPPFHPQPQSQSDQSIFRAYGSSRPRLTAAAIVRAVSNDYEMGDEDPPPARPPRSAGRNAGVGAEAEYDRPTREALAFRGRRARAFRHPILARMGGRPRALGDFVPDDEFDTSYESLLQLAATVGEAKPRSTPSHVISSMETAEYKDWATADSDKRCPICLDDYTPSDPVLKLTNCSHWLHKDCLQQWLAGASTCPVCRKPVHGSSSPRHIGHPPQIQDIQNYWPFGGTWRRGPPPPGPGPSGSGHMSFGPAGASGAWPRR